MSEDIRSMKDILLTIEEYLRRFIEMEESWWHEMERRREEDRQRTAERDATFIERDEAWRQEIRDREAKMEKIDDERLERRIAADHKLLELRVQHEYDLLQRQGSQFREERTLRDKAEQERDEALAEDDALSRKCQSLASKIEVLTKERDDALSQRKTALDLMVTAQAGADLEATYITALEQLVRDYQRADKRDCQCKNCIRASELVGEEAPHAD